MTLAFRKHSKIMVSIPKDDGLASSLKEGEN